PIINAADFQYYPLPCLVRQQPVRRLARLEPTHDSPLPKATHESQGDALRSLFRCPPCIDHQCIRLGRRAPGKWLSNRLPVDGHREFDTWPMTPLQCDRGMVRHGLSYRVRQTWVVGSELAEV